MAVRYWPNQIWLNPAFWGSAVDGAEPKEAPQEGAGVRG